MKTGRWVKWQKSLSTLVGTLKKKSTKAIKSPRHTRMLLQPASGKSTNRAEASQGSASQRAAYLSGAC